MHKLKRIIIGGTIITGCSILVLSVFSKINSNYVNNAIPASFQNVITDKPMIILDAGHGECS